MKAALLQAPYCLELLDDLDVESPGARDVLVRIAHCGVCHSDLHILDGSLPSPLQTVLGHEAAGTIEAMGIGVKELSVGDTVILTLWPSCGRCYYCAR